MARPILVLSRPMRDLKVSQKLRAQWLSLLTVVIVLWCAGARALEVYSLIDANCRVQSGLIIATNESTVTLLGLDGRSIVTPRKSINTVVLFSMLQNPISQIYMDDSLSQRAKDIYVNEESSPQFRGWAIRFVEDLVIFYDTSGKTHVLELADVTKIRSVSHDALQSFNNRAIAQPVLNFAGVDTHCANLSEVHRDGIRPTRILTDKISISEFLSTFQKGFENVESYQERTFFYAKPFLYEKRSKLGLIAYNYYQENNPLLPVFFQWSTGKPYGFQTFDIFGSAPNEWLPLVDPVLSFRSDVKSHFFNGSFAGNLVALAAGSSYYSQDQVVPKRNVFALHQFNYMTLLGADYGSFSVSVGTFFPIFAFQVVNPATQVYERREVLANSLSPAVRAMYTNGPLTIRAIYSQTGESGSGQSTKNLRVLTAQNNSPDTYNLVGGFARGGVDFAFTKEFKAGLDEIYSFANYSEVFAGAPFYFNSTHLTTAAYVEQSFGYYISLKIYGNLFKDSYSYMFPNGSDAPNTITTTVGGAFEFDF